MVVTPGATLDPSSDRDELSTYDAEDRSVARDIRSRGARGSIRAVPGMNDQHRSRSGIEHLVADASQHKRAYVAAAPRAHHHELVVSLPHLLEDPAAGPPMDQPLRHPHSLWYLRARLVQKLPVVALGLLVERDVVNPSTVCRTGQQPRREVGDTGCRETPSSRYPCSRHRTAELWRRGGAGRPADVIAAGYPGQPTATRVRAARAGAATRRSPRAARSKAFFGTSRSKANSTQTVRAGQMKPIASA